MKYNTKGLYMLYVLLFVIGAVLTLVISLFIWFCILPQKLDGTFHNSFSQRLHDYFNLKKLYLLKYTKYLFVMITVGCIVGGLLMLITDVLNGFIYVWYLGSYRISVFRFRGLLLLIFGPIVSRFIQECMAASLMTAAKLDQLHFQVAELQRNSYTESASSHKQNSLRK